MSSERATEPKKRAAAGKKKKPRAAGKKPKTAERRATMSNSISNADRIEGRNEVEQEAIIVRAETGATTAVADAAGGGIDAVASTDGVVALASGSRPGGQGEVDAVVRAIMAMADTKQDPELIVVSAELAVQNALATSVVTDATIGKLAGSFE